LELPEQQFTWGGGGQYQCVHKLMKWKPSNRMLANATQGRLQ
jgi:hypothetical protein